MDELSLTFRLAARLISEAYYLGVDSVEFCKGGDSWSIELVKDTASIKQERIDDKWIASLVYWLRDRTVKTSYPAIFSPSDDAIAFISSDQGLLYFSYSKVEDNKFSIRQIINMSRANAFDRMGLMRPGRTVLEGILQKGKIIIAAGDTEDNAYEAGRFLAGCSNAGRLLRISEDLELSLGAYPLVLITQGTDAAETLFRLRSELKPKLFEQISGVFCQAILDSSCELGEEQISKCEVCRGVGCSGKIGIQSVLAVTESVQEISKKAKSSSEIVKKVYSRGTRALLEDGMRKVQSGKIEKDAVFSVVQEIPEGYLKQAGRGIRPAAPAAIAINSYAKSGELPVDAAKIMLVEDNADQRQILQMVLSAKYKVSCAVHGAEALRILENYKPDLIITDLMMPEMDGVELVSSIRANSKFKNVPIMVLTVVSDPGREYELLDLGADDYCEKTIQRKVLFKRIENLLKRASS